MGLARRTLLWLADRRHTQKLISGAPMTRRVARRFVAGERPEDAVDALRDLQAKGLGGILNLLGEGVTDPAGAEAAAGAYLESISAADAAQVPTTVSIKLTQLGLLFDAPGCRSHLRAIADRAATARLGLEVDMEQSDYVSATIDTYLCAGVEPLPRLAIQAYLHRTPDDLRRLMPAGARVRLVKGAYLEPAAVAISDGRAVTQRFAELATLLLENGDDPAFATHDSSLIDHVAGEARRLRRDRQAFEFQLLYGIRRDLQLRLAASGFRVRVYVPFGSAWYPYLVRRLAEKPANLRFFARALVGR